jgi:hypothetical protein
MTLRRPSSIDIGRKRIGVGEVAIARGDEAKQVVAHLFGIAACIPSRSEYKSME